MKQAHEELQVELGRLAVTPRQVHIGRFGWSDRTLQSRRSWFGALIPFGVALSYWLAVMLGGTLAGKDVQGEVSRVWTYYSHRSGPDYTIEYSVPTPSGPHVDHAYVTRQYYDSLPEAVKTAGGGSQNSRKPSVTVRVLSVGGWTWSWALYDGNQVRLFRAVYPLLLVPGTLTALWLAGYGYLLWRFWVRPRRDLCLVREGRAVMGEVLSITSKKVVYRFLDGSAQEIMGSGPAWGITLHRGAAIVFYDERNPRRNVLLDVAWYRPDVCVAALG